jgi:S-adenosylmethionine-diacylgycerolhomoserine-N-methlytransferase
MSGDPSARLKAYYHLHSRIYDATRWSFLFGRDEILRDLAEICPSPRRILEVGCGTGKNLKNLGKKYPSATLTGLDFSEDMLRVARRRLEPYANRTRWMHQAYTAPVARGESFDLVLFSYSLSMFNPGWSEAILAGLDDLSPSGCVAVVDFHYSPLRWFRKWMGLNHVRMEAHLLPFLTERARPRVARVAKAYGGAWQYFFFAGEKK